MLTNNEIGTVNPLHELKVPKERFNAVVFSDITQALGKMPVDVHEMGIDMAAFSAHKIYGPKGVGALFKRTGEPKIELEPLIHGGGQEQGLRGGTLNVPGIVGFGETCRILKEEFEDEVRRIRGMRDWLEQRLRQEITGIRINGKKNKRICNTSSVTIKDVDARVLIRDIYTVAISTRAACSTSHDGPSHVLKAIGLSDEQAYSTVRFSLGRFTTKEEVDEAVDRLIASVKKLRAN